MYMLTFKCITCLTSLQACGCISPSKSCWPNIRWGPPTWAGVADQGSSGTGRQAVHYRVSPEREALQGGQHRQHANVGHVLQAVARQPQLGKQRQSWSAVPATGSSSCWQTLTCICHEQCSSCRDVGHANMPHSKFLVLLVNAMAPSRPCVDVSALCDRSTDRSLLQPASGCALCRCMA